MFRAFAFPSDLRLSYAFASQGLSSVNFEVVAAAARLVEADPELRWLQPYINYNGIGFGDIDNVRNWVAAASRRPIPSKYATETEIQRSPSVLGFLVLGKWEEVIGK